MVSYDLVPLMSQLWWHIWATHILKLWSDSDTFEHFWNSRLILKSWNNSESWHRFWKLITKAICILCLVSLCNYAFTNMYWLRNWFSESMSTFRIALLFGIYKSRMGPKFQYQSTVSESMCFSESMSTLESLHSFGIDLKFQNGSMVSEWIYFSEYAWPVYATVLPNLQYCSHVLPHCEFFIIRPPDIVCRRTYILPVFLLSFFFLFLPPDLRDRWTELNENRPHGRK